MTNNSSNIINDLFKKLKIVFFVLLAVQFVYFLIAIFIVGKGYLIVLNGWYALIYLNIPVYNISSLLGANKLYKRKLAESSKAQSLEIKIQIYRNANIVRYLTMWAINVFNITFFIVQRDYVFAPFIVFIIVIYFLYLPQKQKFISEQKLTAADFAGIR